MSEKKAYKVNKIHMAVTILIAIVLCFILVMLTAIHPLLLLVGLLVIAGILAIVRSRNVNAFLDWFLVPVEHTGGEKLPNPIEPPKDEVRMVLSSVNDFNARRIMINKDQYNIGRAWDNDFKIEGKNISRHHLKIMYDKKKDICYAADMGSLNGTYLNGKRMDEGKWYELLQGDRLMIDDNPFTVDYAHY